MKKSQRILAIFLVALFMVSSGMGMDIRADAGHGHGYGNSNWYWDEDEYWEEEESDPSDLTGMQITQDSRVSASGIYGDYYKFKNNKPATFKYWRWDNKIDFDWGNGSPIDKSNYFLIQWFGTLEVEKSGEYNLGFEIGKHDAVMIEIDKGYGYETILDEYYKNNNAGTYFSDEIVLNKELDYDFRITYYSAGNNAVAKFLWHQDPVEELPWNINVVTDKGGYLVGDEIDLTLEGINNDTELNDYMDEIKLSVEIDDDFLNVKQAVGFGSNKDVYTSDISVNDRKRHLILEAKELQDGKISEEIIIQGAIIYTISDGGGGGCGCGHHHGWHWHWGWENGNAWEHLRGWGNGNGNGNGWGHAYGRQSVNKKKLIYGDSQLITDETTFNIRKGIIDVTVKDSEGKSLKNIDIMVDGIKIGKTDQYGKLYLENINTGIHRITAGFESGDADQAITMDYDHNEQSITFMEQEEEQLLEVSYLFDSPDAVGGIVNAIKNGWVNGEIILNSNQVLSDLEMGFRSDISSLKIKEVQVFKSEVKIDVDYAINGNKVIFADDISAGETRIVLVYYLGAAVVENQIHEIELDEIKANNQSIKEEKEEFIQVRINAYPDLI